MTHAGKPIGLLVAEDFPPFSRSAAAQAAAARVAELRAAGREIEVIAASPDGEEFMHVDPSGALVHRLAARPLLGRGPEGFGWRATGKALELGYLWRRQIASLEAPLARRELWPLRSVPALRRALGRAPPEASPRPAAGPVRSVDVVVCTYNRREGLAESLATTLAAAARARETGLDCEVTVVYQNDWLPAQLGPLRDSVRLVACSPPGLTRARNAGIAATSRDLVLFTDDDVLADPGLVVAHAAAANRFPSAVGVAGRVLSRIENGRTSRTHAVGQVRPSGHVDPGFESEADDVVLVPHTPMGVNMAFRRARADAAVGRAWFDEALTGTAYREETTLAMELFRRGERFVFEPAASLTHLEATAGGCENRFIGSLEQRAARASLDYLFLHRLHERSGLGRALASLARARRDMEGTPRVRTFVAKSYVNLRGFHLGRRQFRQARASR